MEPADFRKLESLFEYCDEVFQRFYEELLSNKVFSKYFTGEDQIKALLVKQKQNFIATLKESKEQVIQRYYHVGVVHFEHDIPYEVFLSGTHLLRDAFNEAIKDKLGGMELSLLNDALFGFISEAMARGYLDKFILTEKADLQKILVMTRNATFGKERRVLVRHYNWILDLLTAVDQRNFDAMDNLVNEQNSDTDTLYSYIEEHLGVIEPAIQTEEIERIRFRIVANTENIFFYLKRGAYSEALSLIINILEIYKLTLVMDNVISSIVVKKAEDMISEKVRLSETDPLTNVMNRRKFEELLESLLLRAQRSLLPLTIMVLDIDNFKSINDRHGHQTGDRVLVEIAHILADSIRKNDYLVRYGGEEFVIISDDSRIDGALNLAEKIRKNIEGHEFDKAGQVTISIGLAEVGDDDDSTTLFSRADKMLYEAKKNGKNRVFY